MTMSLSPENLRNAVEAAVHLVNLFELRQIFHCHIYPFLLQSSFELGIRSHQHILSVKFANIQEVYHEFELFLM